MSGRGRLIPGVGLALLAVVPIIAGAIITSGTTSATHSSGLAFTPTTLRSQRARPASAIPPGPGSLVALVSRPTKMRAAPAGRTVADLGTRTEFGSPEALWVVQRSGSWLGVISPLVGNGRIGWIPEGAASLGRVRWQLQVSLAARKLTVLRDGRAVERYTVAIGRPDAPTPTGRFAVTDRLRTGDPSGPYGCCILALSARSPHAIQGWNGGNRIAIHSTPDTFSIGQAVSHGCLRLTLDDGRWLLAHIPLGTPTLISS
jgi:lipoprotein-anchoring transpeptidase ErfK/SrfK